MAESTISAFKSALRGGGARPNLFEVDVTFPQAVNLGIQGDGTGQFDSENFSFIDCPHSCFLLPAYRIFQELLAGRRICPFLASL